MTGPVHASKMTDEQFRKACADADSAARRADLARNDARDLAAIMAHYGVATGAAVEPPQPGTITGTTASLARAPAAPIATTRDARTMDNASYATALADIIRSSNSIEANRPTHRGYGSR